MNDLLALNLCLDELIRSSTDGLNYAIEEYLARTRDRNNQQGATSETVETPLTNLKLPTSNSTNLLLHLLHDDLYIPIAKGHGLTATSTGVLIQKTFRKFESIELCQIIENYQQKEGHFIIPPPIYQPMVPLTALERVTQHMQRADQRVTSLDETISRLEGELKQRIESEKARETALQHHIEKEKSSNITVVIVEVNRAADASPLLIDGVSPQDLGEYLN